MGRLQHKLSNYFLANITTNFHEDVCTVTFKALEHKKILNTSQLMCWDEEGKIVFVTFCR